MRSLLDEAVRLREQGRAEVAKDMLLRMLKEYGQNPESSACLDIPAPSVTGEKPADAGSSPEPLYAELLYQTAWTHDVLGLEAEAVPYYEQSLSAGLGGGSRPGALVGLGSTYRTLGQYDRAEQLLRQAIQEYPDHPEFQVFYAMTLYNLERHDKAMEMLLRLLADTSRDPGIGEYARAIRYYAGQLDRIWP